MVSGSWPPERCGVGDYSEALSARLEQRGLEVARIVETDWSWSAREGIARAIERASPDVVHVQYPTLGYRNSRVPAWLTMRLRSLPRVTTLHEYRALLRPTRRLGILPRGVSFWPFLLSDALVFSGEQERDAFASSYFWVRRRSHVIAIGSNIPAASGPLPRQPQLAYFGQICPNRGVEEFVAAAEQMKAAGSAIEPVLIGSVPHAAQEYGREKIARLRELGVEVVLNAEAEQVAQRLAIAEFAYLPFPDGASPKRSSLLAALVNGTIALTPHGAEAPEWLRACTVAAPTPDEAIRRASELLAQPAERKRLRAAALREAARCDWGEIARAYAEIYAQVVAKRGRLKE